MFKLKIIEQENIDNETNQLTINIPNRGTLVVTNNRDGISLDIWSNEEKEEPILASYLLQEDFENV